MGIRSRLQKEATGLSQKALGKLLADEGRAQKVAEAIGAVQRGKQKVDQTQAAVMHQLSVATRADFKGLGKQLSALRRRIKALDDKLGAL